MSSFRQSFCSESWYSCFTVLTNNEEQILSLKNRFFVWRTENHSAVNQYLSLLRTSNHQSPTPAFFTTHKLHLATDPLLFPTRDHGFSEAQILNRSFSVTLRERITPRKLVVSSRRACPKIHSLCHPVMPLRGISH